MIHGTKESSDSPNLAWDVSPGDRFEDRVHVIQGVDGELGARNDVRSQDSTSCVRGVSV